LPGKGREHFFQAMLIAVFALLGLAMLYPIWYTVVVSLNEGYDAQRGGIYWWPRVFTLENYATVLGTTGIVVAYGVTVARTLIGTLCAVFFTSMVAYAFSKKRLIGRKLYTGMGIVTLFFGGGLVPYFLLIRNLGLFDNFLVYIIPALFSFYNLIIFQSFFRGIPAELEESAFIDGAQDFAIFVRIILPLSAPVLATIALFTGVYHWNDYFTGVLYINNENLQPIQTYLYRVIAQNSSNMMMNNAPAGVLYRRVTSQSIRYATMVCTTLPIVCVYPFLQKYFVKGMMLGSIKG
jgi:putative aldouronate transport system permease protein